MLSKTFLTDFDNNVAGYTVNRMFMILLLRYKILLKKIKVTILFALNNCSSNLQEILKY